MFSLALVCLLAGLHKNYSTDYHKKIVGKMAQGPWKKPFDFASHLDLRWGSG